MRVNEVISCEHFPCLDVRHEGFSIPDFDLEVEKVSIVMISEAAPLNPSEGYFTPAASLIQQTTLQAFQDANAAVSSFQDILKMGVYLTHAVKCAKTGYAIQRSTVIECSKILEKELDLFPNVLAFLLMGDVAIQAVNAIAKRSGEPRPIPAGATYKIRGGEYTFRGKRAFPSYLQAGPSFFIEKSKRKMIAEDISSALRSAGIH